MAPKTYVFDIAQELPRVQELHKTCLDLCRHGTYERFKKFMDTSGIVLDSEPLYYFTIREARLPWVPNTFEMLEEAAINGHTHIVGHILKIYPSINLFSSPDLVKAAIRGGNLDVLKILQFHDPRFATQEHNSWESTVIYSLKSPDVRITKFFLDNGADVNVGPTGASGNSLIAAMEAQDPIVGIDTIELLVIRGAWINFAVLESALKHKRCDVLRIFIEHRNKLNFYPSAFNRNEEEKIRKLASKFRSSEKNEVVRLVNELFAIYNGRNPSMMSFTDEKVQFSRHSVTDSMTAWFRKLRIPAKVA